MSAPPMFTKLVAMQENHIVTLLANANSIIGVCKAGMADGRKMQSFLDRGTHVLNSIETFHASLKAKEEELNQLYTVNLNLDPEEVAEKAYAALVGFDKFLDQIPEFDKSILDIADEMQNDPELNPHLTAVYSLANGAKQVPKNAVTVSKMALLTRKKVTIVGLKEVIDFVSIKASSSRLKDIQRQFGLSVIEAGNFSPTTPIGANGVFTPGKALVPQAEGYAFGYLWEFTIQPGNTESPIGSVVGKCFMTVNDRDLFSRLYYAHPIGGYTGETYRDFIPDEEFVEIKPA